MVVDRSRKDVWAMRYLILLLLIPGLSFAAEKPKKAEVSMPVAVSFGTAVDAIHITEWKQTIIWSSSDLPTGSIWSVDKSEIKLTEITVIVP